TNAMITPPITNARAAPTLPAALMKSPVSTIQPKPIIAPNASARTSARPSTFRKSPAPPAEPLLFATSDMAAGPIRPIDRVRGPSTQLQALFDKPSFRSDPRHHYPLRTNPARGAAADAPAPIRPGAAGATAPPGPA